MRDPLADAAALLPGTIIPRQGSDDGLQDLPHRVRQAVASWRRIIEKTPGDKTENYAQACAELGALARTEQMPTRQGILDCLKQMAIDSDIENAGAIFERALTAPAARVRKSGNGATVHAPAADRDEEPAPADSIADFGLPVDADILPLDEAPERRKFPLLPFDQIHIDTERRGYLVKGLLASTGLAVVWGPPKCGKSFWAVDVGMHIALGWEYRSRRVQQAPVVYIALEGQHGLPARIEAFRRHHNVTEAPFYLILVRLDLIAGVVALIADIKSQIGDVMPGAVFLDTLNRSLVGSESKDEDMARYLAAADRLGVELRCAVILVHHCGIDATRPRGHTSLTGSVESQLAVKRGAAGEVVVTVEFAKDFAEGAEVFSMLEPVVVGTDPDGDEITTLVVLPAAPTATTGQRKPVKGAKAVALEILRKAIDEAGTTPPANNHIPANTRTILIETWRTYAYQGSITESDEPDTKRKAFVRAVKDLQAANLVGIWGEYAWLI